MAEPIEPTATERAISAWALARLAFHASEPDSLARLEAEQSSAVAARTLTQLAEVGDETAVEFMAVIDDAEEAIRETAAGYRG